MTRKDTFLVGLVLLVIDLQPAAAQTPPSATDTYDGAGRIATTLYSDQTCVAHLVEFGFAFEVDAHTRRPQRGRAPTRPRMRGPLARPPPVKPS